MACSCGSKSTPPRGSVAAQAAADRAQAEAAARAANPSTTRIGPPRTTAAVSASGQSQSFALQTAAGTTYYGSALERDAAAARLAQRR